MQLGDLQRSIAQIDTGHPGASRSHCFREYSAATADIQHAFAAESGDAIDVIEPQRIDIVQRLEFRAGIPPAVGELAEFVELERVDVDHGGSRDFSRRRLALTRDPFFPLRGLRGELGWLKPGQA